MCSFIVNSVDRHPQVILESQCSRSYHFVIFEYLTFGYFLEGQLYPKSLMFLSLKAIKNTE